ncbi:hypothetical protein RBE51_20760 [Pseudomonas taiwanensis]|uniref:hypothetical protein n=1 Tax=Pseudomonas taiwanensis TaxID=470150 RepID=UPI0028E09BE1|nr:hypothetical protein [Pseudomonas taiwanensis]MDT8925228.1 hypothetical protein [Pseudomonas taiwanensis]
MSRTLRQGKPTRNRQYYQQIGVIYSEADVYQFSGIPRWVDDWRNPGSYEDHVRQSVRKHHRDKGGRSVPGFCRRLDVKKQGREHRHAIHQALRSGDLEVTLSRLNKRNSYNWW